MPLPSCTKCRLCLSVCACVCLLSTQYLHDVEEHLDITIPEITRDLKVEQNEFDGKVTYGQKKKPTSMCFFTHFYFTLSAGIESWLKSLFEKLRLRRSSPA